MYLKIENDIVRKNIEIFKIILKRAIQFHETAETEKTAQHFKAFIHRGCGEIRFSDFSGEPLDAHNWAPVSFLFSLPKTEEESFSINISDLNEHSFTSEGFQSTALSAIQETLKTIQFISKFLPRLKNLSAVLKEFSLMNLDTFLDTLSTKDLVHEAWHFLKRDECERLLLKQPQGTFLFRKDEFATVLEKRLKIEHKEPITCITLSYVAYFNKTSDLTLIKKKNGWLIYNDDPSLSGPIYPSASSLLESLRGVLKSPLLHPY